MNQDVRLLAYMPTPGGLTGAPRRLLALASALREQGIHSCIASDSASLLIREAQMQEHETAAIDTHGVLALRQRALFGRGFLFRIRVAITLLAHNGRLKRVISNRHADIVWLRGSKGIAFAGLGTILSRRPLVWDIDYELPSRGAVRLLHYFGLWAAKLIVFQYEGAANAIFGDSLAYRYRQKCAAILPGIGFAPLQARSFAATSSVANPERGVFRIVQVGTICERKNQRFTIEVLSKLDMSDLPRPIKLILVGNAIDEAYAHLLQKLVKNLDLGATVEFTGWRDDVHNIVASSDLMLMPSFDEGVPNALQEAMYMGIPVIGSPVGGIPAVINHGETGWVLPLDSKKLWADQVKECMESPELCRRVGYKASIYARENFSTETWGRRYADLIRSIVRETKGR